MVKERQWMVKERQWMVKERQERSRKGRAPHLRATLSTLYLHHRKENTVI